MTIPAVDQNVCGAWTQQELGLYAKLPYFLDAAQTEFRNRWATWPKLLESVDWKPNMGDTMKRVMVEPTPVLRQFTDPSLLRVAPKTDVVGVRERTATAQIFWQDFVSPHFNYLPSFQDFMKGNIGPSMDNLNKQMSIFEEMFYRTYIFNWAPYVYVAGYGLVAAPQGNVASETNKTGKYGSWLAQEVHNKLPANGYLSFTEIYRALSQGEEEIGMTPYEGSGLPGGDSAPLNEKFCLVQSPQSWNVLVDDPWLKENRPLNMNIVNGVYKGDFFGKVTSKLEKYPIRAALDNDLIPTYNVPETIQMDPDRDDYGRTYPNPLYATIQNSPIEWAFLVGGASYSKIRVGPPPSDFAKPLDGREMNWNGKSYMTKQFMVPCLAADGVTTSYDLNSFGRYLRIQGSLSLGIVGDNKHNILPICFRRKSFLSTSVTGSAAITPLV